MSDTIDFPKTIRIGILVYDGFEPIDVWGFTEAFAISRFIGTGYLDPPAYPFKILFISNEVRPTGKKQATPSPVKSENGPRVAPDMFRDDALKEHFDLIMIPGGITGPLLEPDSKTVKDLIAWVRAMDKRVSLMTSVCTGAAVLAYSGLLDGKPAATNHAAFGGLRHMDQRFYGTTCRVGWTQGVTLHPPEYRQARTWLFIWCNVWQDEQSQNRQRCRRNTIGIATLSNQFFIPSRRPCLTVVILRERETRKIYMNAKRARYT